jgi:hypothetical protein
VFVPVSNDGCEPIVDGTENMKRMLNGFDQCKQATILGVIDNASATVQRCMVWQLWGTC